MAQETFYDTWSPDHPVRRWGNGEDDAFLSLGDAARRCSRATEVPESTVRSMLAEGATFTTTFALYTLDTGLATGTGS